LPRGNRADARHSIGLTRVRDRVRRVWGGGDQHDVDLVVLDEIVGDSRCGRIGRLAVLDDDLNWMVNTADDDAFGKDWLQGVDDE